MYERSLYLLAGGTRQLIGKAEEYKAIISRAFLLPTIIITDLRHLQPHCYQQSVRACQALSQCEGTTASQVFFSEVDSKVTTTI